MTTMPMITGSPRQLTLQSWLKDQPLASGVQETEQSIQRHPTDLQQRWLLFQLLCLQGDWSRGLKQLQLCAQLQVGFSQQAQVYRGLIGCELFRQACFAGKKVPAFIRPQPAWLDQLLEAIAFNQTGDEVRADDIRENALNAAEVSCGVNEPDKTFAWISDSDSWIGPNIELVIGGMYAWVPFSQIRQISSAPPQTMLDFLWKPARLQLTDDSEHRVFLMARYCGSEFGDDAVKLCRSTIWNESGRTSVRALGQKTWQTDSGDFSLLDITSCLFNSFAQQKGEMHV